MNLRISLFFLAFFSFTAEADQIYTNIDNQQLKSLQAQGIPVFDIRRDDEWKETGIVEGSHKLTFIDDKGRLMPDFVSKFTQSVGKDEPVILICRTGHRTEALAQALTEQLGYKKIYNVKNGITRWISEGLPVIHN